MTAVIEWVAVVLAIAYLALAIRQSLWCWLCAAVSSTLYVYLTWNAELPMQAALNGFYVAMAGYGFWQWHRGEFGSERPVTRWPLWQHCVALTAIAVIAWGSAQLLGAYATSALPLADSAISFAAVWATFLIAHKELNNWFYWFAIDVATVALLVHQGLVTAAIPFVVYLVMIPFGYVAWRRTARDAAYAR